MVDGGVELPEAIQMLHQYLQKHEILNKRFTFITAGEWDFQNCLPEEIVEKNLKNVPVYLSRYINVSDIFPQKKYDNKGYNFPVKGLRKMMDIVGLEFEGKQHSGIDDAHNIA